nr:unnamed protein product [Callosobruchus analis]
MVKLLVWSKVYPPLTKTRALVKAYNDTRVLATSYYNTIRDLAPLQKQSPKDLKLLICTFLENVEALKALSFPVDSWDFLLFNMLHQKLDEVTRSEFEIQFRNQELPSFSDLSRFVQEQCKAKLKLKNPHRFQILLNLSAISLRLYHLWLVQMIILRPDLTSRKNVSAAHRLIAYIAALVSLLRLPLIDLPW